MISIMQYDSVQVSEDINPVIKAGMEGLVMDVYKDSAELMFNSETGMTYSFNGKNTFLIPIKKLKIPDYA